MTNVELLGLQATSLGIATSLGAVLERSLVRFGAGGWRGQWGRRATVALASARSKGATLTTVINDGYGEMGER